MPRYTYGGGAPNPAPYDSDREECPQCGGSGVEEWETGCSWDFHVRYARDFCHVCGGEGTLEQEPEYEDQPQQLGWPGEPGDDA